MTKAQLTAVVKLVRGQRRQIKRLVNLLLDVLDKKPKSKAAALHYIFIEATLYELIEREGDNDLRG